MKTQQPIWKFVANLGDVHPIDHGGYHVFVDETGVYPPEAEYLVSPDSDNQPESEGPWRIYRFILEPCTYINGILSDNKFHPDKPAWFAGPGSRRAERPQDTCYLKDLAESWCKEVEQLASMFTSTDPCENAEAWRMVGEYHGFENLDSYPLIIKSRSEVEARYKGHPYTSVN